MKVVIAGIFSGLLAFMLIFVVAYYKIEVEQFMSKHATVFSFVLMVLLGVVVYIAFNTSGIFKIEKDRHEKCPRLRNRICMYPNCNCKFDNNGK